MDSVLAKETNRHFERLHADAVMRACSMRPVSTNSTVRSTTSGTGASLIVDTSTICPERK